MIRKLLSTCFYVGYGPGMPGTYGSLAALAVGLALVFLAGRKAAGLILLGLVVVFAFVGARLGAWAESHFARRDPSPFVLDEAVGCFLALAAVLLCFPGAKLLPIAGLPFLFFRIFDILKPYPVHTVERIPGGWGIMLDDLVAACYAAAASIAGMLLFFA